MFTRSVDEIDRMFGAMDLLRTRMDKLFTEMNGPCRHGAGFTRGTHTPGINLLENAESFEVRAELPGTSKDDISIRLQDNYLEISGKREIETSQGFTPHRSERSAATFSRSLALPREVDAQNVDAVLKDGILYLTLPKSEAARPRQITIQ